MNATAASTSIQFGCSESLLGGCDFALGGLTFSEGFSFGVVAVARKRPGYECQQRTGRESRGLGISARHNPFIFESVGPGAASSRTLAPNRHDVTGLQPSDHSTATGVRTVSGASPHALSIFMYDL